MTSALVVDCVVVTAAELLCWPLLAAPVQESAFLKGAVACSSVSCTHICAQQHAVAAQIVDTAKLASNDTNGMKAATKTCRGAAQSALCILE